MRCYGALLRGNPKNIRMDPGKSSQVTVPILLFLLCLSLSLPLREARGADDWVCTADPESGNWDCHPAGQVQLQIPPAVPGAPMQRESQSAAPVKAPPPVEPAAPAQAIEPPRPSATSQPTPPAKGPATPAVRETGAPMLPSPVTRPAPASAAQARSAAPLAPQWALCNADAQYDVPLPSGEELDQPPPEGAVGIESNEARALRLGEYLLNGDVLVERGPQRLEAEKVTYDQAAGVVRAAGGLHFFQRGLAISADTAQVYLQRDLAELRDVRYRLIPRHAHGAASEGRLEGVEVSRWSNVSYTTCDPGDNFWVLKSRRLKLDLGSGVGKAQQATLRVKSVPVLYLPYMSFPIDDRRKSGFLPATVGSGDASGFDLYLPYYWNIAPNRDATFTPRFMEQRGVQMRGEYRYLYPHSSGQLDAEYLPHDALYGKQRSLVAFHHAGSIRPQWTTDIAINHVSDDNYFEDLGTSLELASTTHLERHLDTTYYGSYWSLFGRLQDYQTLSGSSPYRRTPQLLYTATPPLPWRFAESRLTGEFVHFDGDPQVTGSRFDLNPGIDFPLQGAAWFLTPALDLHYTHYLLGGTAPGAADDVERTLPVFSLDSGVFLERELSWRDRPLVQTLEPRFYYLYVPYQDQSDIPIFDTALLDFSFAQLYRDNRFTGGDRIGDANQLTLGLASRLIDRKDGTELLSAGIGDILYFRDRKVQLPNQPIETRNRSDFVGEVSARLIKDWSARAAVQWNTETVETEKSVLEIHYQPKADRILNFAYRFRTGILEQTDLSALWPLSPAWHVVARWNRSLRDNINLERLAGLEYQSCCWALRFVWRNYVNDPLSNSNNAYFLQLELKGLSRLGQAGTTLLERGILGYEQYQEYLQPE